MSSKLEIVKIIVKNKGISGLFKKIYFYYIFSIFYLPICYIKTQKIKSEKDFVRVFDFIFYGCKKYLSPMQIKSELLSLLDVVKELQPKVILEVGTARGGTLFLITQVAPNDATIISLDLPGGKFGGGYPFWKIPLYKSFRKATQNLHLIRMSSQKIEALKKVKQILQSKKIDFLLIDGDHSYRGVKRDYDLYSPLVRHGGIIAFHDIAPHSSHSGCEVKKFWDEVKSNYEYKEFIENENQDWAGVGIIKI